MFRNEDVLSRAVDRIVKKNTSYATSNPWSPMQPVATDVLEKKWKRQLMFQDPFIRGFLNPKTSRPNTAREHGSSVDAIGAAYDNTIGDAMEATKSIKGSRTQRSAGTGRKKQAGSIHSRQRSFVLRQHINDQQIPEYDAIMDQHAKFVETPGFSEHLDITRPLTPEHQHMLDSRLKMKEDADLAVMALTGILPSSPNARPPSHRRGGRVNHRPTTGVPKRRQGTRSARMGLQSAGPTLRSTTQASATALEQPVLEAGLESVVDWSMSPLMEYVVDPSGLDPPSDAVLTADGEAAGVEELFHAATSRIERLWEEVCFPDLMRHKFRATYMVTADSTNYAALLAEITCLVLYRRNILQVLQAVCQREEELQMVLQDELATAQSLWKLRNLTVTCLNAIEQWQKVFPWNRVFVYEGQEYIQKTKTDLSLVRNKLSSTLQENQESRDIGN